MSRFKNLKSLLEKEEDREREHEEEQLRQGEASAPITFICDSSLTKILIPAGSRILSSPAPYAFPWTERFLYLIV